MDQLISLLIIEDDDEIRNIIRGIFELNGHPVLVSASKDEGLNVYRQFKPDVLLLDLCLPDCDDGFEVLQKLRIDEPNLYIIILSSMQNIEEKEKAYLLGADYYLTKNVVSVDELYSSVITAIDNIRIRRAIHSIRSKNLYIDFEKIKITKNGKEIELPVHQFEILELLARNAGKFITKEFIIKKIWKDKTFGNSESLKVEIRKIRLKIEDNPEEPEIITTKHDYGYRFNIL